MTIAGIWQVARSHFNSSKTSNPVRSGIITPLKNCDQLLKKQPIAIFPLSWLPRSQYNEIVFTSFSANTEKLSSSSPITTFAAESGADEGEFVIEGGISSPLAADISNNRVSMTIGVRALSRVPIMGKARIPCQSLTIGVDNSSISCCWRSMTSSRALRKISVTQRPSWSNKLVES